VRQALVLNPSNTTIKLLEYCSIAEISDGRVADDAQDKEAAMLKLKQILLAAALFGGFAMVATASILAKVGVQEGLSVEAQIDTLDLTSKARDLPLQTADGAF
jgi:hypothetical protein